MALIHCRECRGRTSEFAATCPHCGVDKPMPEDRKSAVKARLYWPEPPVTAQGVFWAVVGAQVFVAVAGGLLALIVVLVRNA
jgi:hypothetical protein